MRLFVDNYGRKGAALGTDGQPVLGLQAKEITKLVDQTELWFVLVANPDGYDYTFTPANRLWRKNLRDNDGDGADQQRRRRRPQPQLPDALGLRRRGLEPIASIGDLPRHRPRSPSPRPRRSTG